MALRKLIKKVKDLVINGKKVKCSFNKNGNRKVGSDIWTFNTLFGNHTYYIPELDIEVDGTCGKHCTGCIHECYVMKSYRMYTKRNSDGTKGDFRKNACSVKYGHALNTIAMRADEDKMYMDLNNQIQRRKNKSKELIIRIHASGELETVSQLIVWIKLARQNPNVIFYVYSKAYDIIVPTLLKGLVPGNLVILVSIWNEYGIAEYKQVEHLRNVKAFVVLTGFNYESHGIHVTTMCPAYRMDENGKVQLVHELTCHACGKCFRLLDGLKVIGCLPH